MSAIYFEKWFGDNSISNKNPGNFKPINSAKTSSSCGGTSYPHSELNHDFKRTIVRVAGETGFGYDRTDDKLVCKRCGFKTTGFFHDSAVKTLVDQVNSPEYETMRILEDEEYRDRLRKRFKFYK